MAIFRARHQRIQKKIRRWGKRLNGQIIRFLLWKSKYVSDQNFVLVLSALVGLLAGLAAVGLKFSVHFIQHQLAREEFYLDGFHYWSLLFPFVGLLLTIFIAKILRVDLGHGITDILYAISRKGGKIRKSNTYSRALTSVSTVGFGGSAGLEAPIVMTGAALGSNLARSLMLNKKGRVTLLACGVAGVISAIFNAPIAGVIFTLEVILVESSAMSLIPILLASVVAKLVSMGLLGEELLFSFKIRDSFQAWDSLYCLGLGVVLGLSSLLFVGVLQRTERLMQRLQQKFGRMLAGGISLSLLILAFPHVYGEGYQLILSFLEGNEFHVFRRNVIFTFDNLPDEWLFVLYVIGIALAKMLASAVTISAGGSGGIFAPSLFIGGVMGWAFARLMNMYGLGEISESNFTLFGMCAAISGVQYAPLTAIFLIAELTGGYELFVPLMLVSATAYSTVSYFQPHSIYTRELIRRGDLVQGNHDRKVLRQMRITSLIERNFEAIPPEGTLRDVVEAVKKSQRNLFPVVNDEGEFVGFIPLNDVRQIMFDPEKQDTLKVENLMRYADDFVDYSENMEQVMQRFEDTGAWNLPVLRKGKYVGFISKSTIFNEYRRVLQREE